jgi:hypothetical protein
MKRLQMKYMLLMMCLFATAILCAAAPSLFGQDARQPALVRGYFTYLPLRGVTPEEIRSQAAAATTIPLWDYHNILSPVDGVQYSGRMVGRSPFFHGSRTTNISTYVVPVIINITNADRSVSVFDPTANDPNCSPAGSPLFLFQHSPIFQSTDFVMGGIDMGVTQYVDAFQRANFWGANVSITGNRYHTMLSPVTTVGSVTVNVPMGSGITVDATQFQGGCGNLGIIDMTWFDPYVQSTIIPSVAGQGVAPTTFPILLLSNVVMSQGPPAPPPGSYVLGYHASFSMGGPIQTYSPLEYDTTGIFPAGNDISIPSHEIGEWMDDPTGTNQTPLWGHIGQQSGCQNNLEVGDPLTNTLFPTVSTASFLVPYHPQELAFFSWFFRQSPSIGAGGVYSNSSTFTTGAGPVCM